MKCNPQSFQFRTVCSLPVVTQWGPSADHGQQSRSDTVYYGKIHIRSTLCLLASEQSPTSRTRTPWYTHFWEEDGAFVRSCYYSEYGKHLTRQRVGLFRPPAGSQVHSASLLSSLDLLLQQNGATEQSPRRCPVELPCSASATPTPTQLTGTGPSQSTG